MFCCNSALQAQLIWGPVRSQQFDDDEGDQKFFAILSGTKGALGHHIINSSGQDIGNERWKCFAKAVQLRPGFVKQVSCVHHVLQETTKEDIRTIWEIVGDVQMVHDHNEPKA